MEKSKFWLRLGEWFRPSHRMAVVETGSSLPPIDSAMVQRADIGETASGHNGNGNHVAVEAREVGHANGRLFRRQTEVRRLEDGLVRVTQLVDSMQKHFELQDHRSEMIAASLDRLASSLAHLPEASRGQLDVLSTMRDVLEQHAARARRFEDSVAQLPQLADAQRETMAAIGRQLDGTRQTSDRVAVSLDRFQEAVTALSEATVGSATAFRQVHTDSLQREERMARMLEQQTRRFTFFACVAIGVAVIVAGLGLVMAWSR